MMQTRGRVNWNTLPGFAVWAGPGRAGYSPPAKFHSCGGDVFCLPSTCEVVRRTILQWGYFSATLPRTHKKEAGTAPRQARIVLKLCFHLRILDTSPTVTTTAR